MVTPFIPLGTRELITISKVIIMILTCDHTRDREGRP